MREKIQVLLSLKNKPKWPDFQNLKHIAFKQNFNGGQFNGKI